MEPSAKKTTKMKALTYWDPFRELEDMQHRLSTVLGRQLNRRQDGDKELITVAEWAPVVDIIEDETEYLIKVDLPEIKKEEVKVTVETAYSFFLASVSWKKKKKAENITVLRGPTAALAAPSACRTMRTPRR
jgi:HSP20 family protein